MAQMQAAVLHKAGDLRLEEVRAVERPESPDDVLIAMRAVGLCGSDVHYWLEGRIGHFVVEKPMILGHECAGEIVAVGDNVRHLRPGDRVAIEPGVPCRTCRYCVEGRYNLCEHMRFYATPPVDGALTQYVSHPASLVYRLPDSISYAEAAMIEPFSVGLHACRRGNVQPGRTLLVSGAGPVGLLAMMAAQCFGATRIFVTDVKDDRLGMARRLGAERTFRADSEDLADQVREATGGHGVDIVLECSGAPQAVRQSVEVARPGGTVVWVGIGPASFEFPTLVVGLKELDVKGLFRYMNTWPASIELLEAGRLDFAPLITHHFGLDQVLDAFETTRTQAGGAIKVVVDIE